MKKHIEIAACLRSQLSNQFGLTHTPTQLGWQGQINCGLGGVVSGMTSKMMLDVVRNNLWGDDKPTIFFGSGIYTTPLSAYITYTAIGGGGGGGGTGGASGGSGSSGVISVSGGGTGSIGTATSGNGASYITYQNPITWSTGTPTSAAQTYSGMYSIGGNLIAPSYEYYPPDRSPWSVLA